MLDPSQNFYQNSLIHILVVQLTTEQKHKLFFGRSYDTIV